MFEWRVHWLCRAGEEQFEVEEAPVSGLDAPSSNHSICRFTRPAQGDADVAALELTPVLSDRPIVSRPTAPVTLLPGKTATVFVITPIWVAIQDNRSERLIELPTIRLSDTWFGESSREGQLCYASRRNARLDPDRLIHHPLSAYTRIVLDNRTSRSILVEKIRIPVPHLSLFVDGKGHFWTQAIHVTRQDGVDRPTIRLERPSKRVFNEVTEISKPRESDRINRLGRALAGLIG